MTAETSGLGPVTLTVNGETVTRYVEPRMLLSDFIRQELLLTGTHVGCEHGVCGACTVLIDGKSARSCLIFAAQVEGACITTIEALTGKSGELSALQQAFADHHALQCGFCTPGFLMTATELLRMHPGASRDEIRETISGNLCRCTGYETIIDAIAATGATMSADGGST